MDIIYRNIFTQEKEVIFFSYIFNTDLIVLFITIVSLREKINLCILI